jgi:uncharacterized short protein YbdD (DUF466 family)
MGLDYLGRPKKNKPTEESKSGYLKKWRKENPDKVKKHNKKSLVYLKKWRKENPDKVREYNKKYIQKRKSKS